MDQIVRDSIYLVGGGGDSITNATLDQVFRQNLKFTYFLK